MHNSYEYHSQIVMKPHRSGFTLLRRL